MSIPDDVSDIIEPFTGNKDMLKNFDLSKFTVEMYDIEPKHKDITLRDTLLTPPDYTDILLTHHTW